MSSNEICNDETNKNIATITDLEEDYVTEDQQQENGFANNIASYKFVIGISKPGEERIGLRTAKKSKLTVKGLLGI